MVSRQLAAAQRALNAVHKLQVHAPADAVAAAPPAVPFTLHYKLIAASLELSFFTFEKRMASHIQRNTQRGMKCFDVDHFVARNADVRSHSQLPHVVWRFFVYVGQFEDRAYRWVRMGVRMRAHGSRAGSMASVLACPWLHAAPMRAPCRPHAGPCGPHAAAMHTMQLTSMRPHAPPCMQVHLPHGL